MSEGPEEAARRSSVLIQAGLVLASELSLPSVLQRIVELACDVADARYGALGVLDPDGRIDGFVTHGVTEDERRAIGSLPGGKGILGALIRDATPLRLARIEDDPRSVGFPPNHPSMTSFLGVPVSVRSTVYGNLYLTEKRGAPEFTEEDERAVVTLAAQAGVAIENARLYAEVERLAVLADRERIATELHDGVIQSLFAVGMALQGAEMVAGDRAAVRERLAAAVDDIDRVIRDLRNYIFGLRPGILADRELDRALRDLAKGIVEPAGLGVEVTVDPEVAAALASRAAEVIQAAREALSNAARHSKGTTVRLGLNASDGEAVLEVADDGAGFEPEEAEGRGHGLRNLRARAGGLGGTVEVESRSGEGTTIRVHIPL